MKDLQQPVGKAIAKLHIGRRRRQASGFNISLNLYVFSIVVITITDRASHEEK